MRTRTKSTVEVAKPTLLPTSPASNNPHTFSYMTTEDRLSRLPDSVWDCERCGEENTMQLRRSSLNEQFFADDVGLKCSVCYYYATHGIAFESSQQFKRELNERDSRVRDYTEEDGDPVKERLEALGYMAKSESL